MAVLPLSEDGGVRFPQKLHRCLEETQKNGQWHVISWLPDGKFFKIHDKEEFIRSIMPAFFDLTKYKSFQRNLNLWGFMTVPKGPEKGKCCNPYFLRGFPLYCKAMKRVTIKGNGAKKPYSSVNIIKEAPSSSNAACSRSSSFVVPQDYSAKASLSAGKQSVQPLSQQVVSQQQQQQMASLADELINRLALQRLRDEDSALLLEQQQRQQQRSADPAIALLTKLLLSQQQSSTTNDTTSLGREHPLVALLAARPEISSLLGAASLLRI
jgi:hypothetical protein